MDETTPEAPTARHRKARHRRKSTSVPIRAQILSPKRTTKQLAERSSSGLSTQVKRLIRNGSFGTRFAHVKHTAPRDAQNVKYVRIGQMNTFLGVGTACKFNSRA